MDALALFRKLSSFHRVNMSRLCQTIFVQSTIFDDLTTAFCQYYNCPVIKFIMPHETQLSDRFKLMTTFWVNSECIYMHNLKNKCFCMSKIHFLWNNTSGSDSWSKHRCTTWYTNKQSLHSPISSLGSTFHSVRLGSFDLRICCFMFIITLFYMCICDTIWENLSDVALVRFQ